MNDATFQKLEFDEIRRVLADECGTTLGKQLARSIRPGTRVSVVRAWLTQIRELMAVWEDHDLPPMGGVHDIRDKIRASAFPAPLEPDALAEVAETLRTTGRVCDWFQTVADALPSLAGLRARIQDMSPIAESINEAIDPRGAVRDYASEKLSSLRRAIEDARTRVGIVFERILRQSSLTRMLQYEGATFHNDRSVLPLKAEHRGRIPGIIHRVSDTGSTLFVEPAESVELNNTIVRLRSEEGKEVTRILRLLTQKVQVNAEVIMTTLKAIGVLDLLSAKCRYARKRSCMIPEIDDEPVLNLHDARHPILVELFEQEAAEGGPVREVVPIDVRLGDDFDVLVITGPNTGGKTVALKAVGLIALMTQCGVPVPVGPGSRLGVFRNIFIDIGDEQSLQQSLSTFSSHLANQLDIIRHSGPRALVFIDELGAGTDPDEGAAIGQAIITELGRLKTKAIVTTHLSALKALAFTMPRVENGSVEFDTKTLEPTFHLRIGEPGNSNALTIARRLGMPERLVKLAERCAANSTRALNRAITGTLQSRRSAEAARRAARNATLEATREREKFKSHTRSLERQQRAFAEWTVWVGRLQPGDEVFVKPLAKTAKVVRMELQQQRALVNGGAMDLEVPLRDIDRVVGDR